MSEKEKKILTIHREDVKAYFSDARDYMNANESVYIPQLTRGVAVLIKRFFKNLLSTPKNDEMFTVQYPEEHAEYPMSYRGLHRLVRREDGSPKCVACYMCATACPSECIYIVAEEHEDSSIEKRPKAFYIDELRCIFCGFCEEACPKDAIRLDTGFHPPSSGTREEMLYNKDKLLSKNGRDGTWPTEGKPSEDYEPHY